MRWLADTMTPYPTRNTDQKNEIMTTAQKTFDLFSEMNVFSGLSHAGVAYDHSKGLWEVVGNFHDENGYRHGRLAQFADVADAVEFKALCNAR